MINSGKLFPFIMPNQPPLVLRPTHPTPLLVLLGKREGILGEKEGGRERERNESNHLTLRGRSERDREGVYKEEIIVRG